jgi:hypothetical protein
MFKKVETSFGKLRAYCENENFSGWDPYDGLNSAVFNSLPIIRTNRFFRLAWIQLFKRNPVNLRGLLLVPKGENPKGLGLFLSAYCNLYKIDPKEEYLSRINVLAEKLINLRSQGYSGACWGYNFDWQSKAFFQPKYTPTVVASTFIGYALLDAYDITRNETYKNYGISVCDFILKDLNRTTDANGDFSFSYSPLDKTQVFNASLLGSRMLARAYHYTNNKAFKEAAGKSVAFCCKRQNKDGSWGYGTLPFHQWIDSFHTGYNLECISEYQRYTGDNSFEKHLKSGFDYYIRNFFTDEGIPRYYNNSVFPIDIHSTAQLIITLERLSLLIKHKTVAERVLDWTIDNMQRKNGSFYYQKNKYYTNKIPYMRWTQAWMFYAMSVYLSNININSLKKLELVDNIYLLN